jgi:fused signal recognition particle receptor
MFKALKDKFASWLKKPSDSKKPKKKKTKKSDKKKTSKKQNKGIIKNEENKKVVEETKEKEEKPGFFAKLVKKITTSTLSESQFDELFSEFEMTLLENNVALNVVDKIRESLKKDLVGIEIKKEKVESVVLQSLKDSISNVLIEPPDLIEKIKKHLGVYTIIFFGINGAGKTTTIAKLTSLLEKNNISCVLAAADTFRAASIEQLQKHADKLKIPLIKHNYGSDPAAVAFDAKKYAEKNKINVVLIDTAGRMYTKANLMKEMEKIIRISKPDLKFFVAESITGNDAVEQAKTFSEAIGIDGIILTKADVDEKAGAILSVSHVTQKPIYFLGTGQSYSDLKPFRKSNVLKNLGLE